MGQTYNITMKHFNGVDYDTLLPESVRMEKITYSGNGLYGESSPTSVTFSVAPQLVLLPNYGMPDKDGTLWRLQTNQSFTPAELFSTNYVQIASFASAADGVLYAKKSDDEKTFSWYSDKLAGAQSNVLGKIYYCFGISGLASVPNQNENDFFIQKSGSFIVPRTGRYYLELHGGGGSGGYRAGGGGSGQTYSEIILTKDTIIPVTVGAGGKISGESGSAGGTTTFGEYSVAGGNPPIYYSSNPGTGSGNVGENGSSNNGGSGGGLFPNSGRGGDTGGDTPYKASGSEGLVYLKYLGE